MMIRKIYLTLALSAITVLNTFAQSDGTHKLAAAEVTKVNEVLDAYLRTFNAKDLKGWEGTYHFPHYRLASGKMSVLEKAGLRDSANVFGPLIKAGWDYSKWDHRNIVQASENKVHVDTKFTRFRKDGSIVASYESLYVLTKEDGKWAVKLRSSFAE
ncbi:hypothetical protein FEM33_14765 [Dyadobacter flavalbus]|uniref:Nuclear transport factor 2 family protein n=1 Tax=Dyadobacter flavalbus TaxID=2579942 RepID=A0A5M8QY93_9BACT|nr:hypothetical protein [Dyadobacter flavalbus]KAA6438962.1 hypothetical protein FEM33_14765 [Dyadobacter flavalbus]